MNIYVVSQEYSVDGTYENLSAHTSLADAQEFARGRGGVARWEESRAHGHCWESLDGDGIYLVDELELRTGVASNFRHED